MTIFCQFIQGNLLLFFFSTLGAIIFDEKGGLYGVNEAMHPSGVAVFFVHTKNFQTRPESAFTYSEIAGRQTSVPFGMAEGF